MQRSLTRALAAACVLTLFVTACGDDDDTTTTGGDAGEEAAGGDVDAYCDIVGELNSQAGPPTVEQMEEIKDVRPDEIGTEVDALADAIIAAEGDIGAAFSDPELEAQAAVLDEFEAENCEFEDPAAGGEVDPEFAAYCAASAAIDEGGGPPDADQIRELVELAPDAISDPAETVSAALESTGGDVEAIFSDPAVGAAIGEIEAWEAENCGGGEEGEDGDLEAAEGAEVVPVVGVDFGYEDVPAEIASGPVAFEFTNEGEAIHEAALFSLDGTSVDDLIAETEAAFESGDEDSIDDVGFAFSPPGGDPRYINTELEAGEYVFICFIPGPEGKPHYELGMQQTFSVS